MMEKEREGESGEKRGIERERKKEIESDKGRGGKSERVGTPVHGGPRVPEPILPSYLNSNSKYRRGSLTYCLFRSCAGERATVNARIQPNTLTFRLFLCSILFYFSLL